MARASYDCPVSFRFVLFSFSLFFIFKRSGAHRDLPSFPTRRSSDLGIGVRGGLKGSDEPLKPLFQTTSLVDRKSTRLNSSHLGISYAVFRLKKHTRVHRHTQTALGIWPSLHVCIPFLST